MAAIRWAVNHKEEWEVVCGLRPAGISRNMDIYWMLREDGLRELQEMVLCRVYAMTLEEQCPDGPGAPL